MVEIFHRTPYSSSVTFEEEAKIDKKDYQLVARMNVGTVGDAWNLSQNGIREWIRIKEVEPLVDVPSCRSTSISDVFALNGKLHLVMMDGYKSIEWGDVADFTEAFKRKI
ncbi:hypothetical protein [Pontibacter litorisediminis]|uniref:hypothetical protein n=1 Tax=Pontibacter litorisediminis TaxID=1846260 RepID=UPI0023EB6448|nr:hypothetical protein [Pontibacter litorisediminis]